MGLRVKASVKRPSLIWPGDDHRLWHEVAHQEDYTQYLGGGARGRLWAALWVAQGSVVPRGSRVISIEGERTGLGISLESLLTWMGLVEGRAGRSTGYNWATFDVV